MRQAGQTKTHEDSKRVPEREKHALTWNPAPPPPPNHCPFLCPRAKDTQCCDSRQTGKTKRHTHSALKVGFSLDGGLLGLRYLSWNSSGMLKGTATLNGPSNSPTVKRSASPSVARQSITIVRQKGGQHSSLAKWALKKSKFFCVFLSPPPPPRLQESKQTFPIRISGGKYRHKPHFPASFFKLSCN